MAIAVLTKVIVRDALQAAAPAQGTRFAAPSQAAGLAGHTQTPWPSPAPTHPLPGASRGLPSS
jgi:hypothetical protein